MATGELLKPGIEVIQQIRRTSPTVLRPTLAPCIVGPAFEVVNVLNSDGTINPKAKYGVYAQVSKAIAESAFPDPRGNIDELDIIESTIRTYMLHGGSLRNLPLVPGSSFLATLHRAGKASIKTDLFNGVAGKTLNGLSLVFCIDNPTSADTTKDITVTFVGSGNLTSQQVADQINAAAGRVIASVVYDTPGNSATDRVLISSPTFGAMSSITIRPSSANSVLQIGYISGDPQPGNHTERVVGYGLRGQDDSNNDTTTPWIEFYRGDYVLDGVASSSGGGPAFRALAGFVDLASGSFVTGIQAAVTFSGGTPTVPLAEGDYVICDGVRLKSGEVAKVENGRFKIGTVNTLLSTADASGVYTSKVYDIQQVGTVLDADPFSPAYVYFVANGLSRSTATATPATVTGTGVTPTSPTAASVSTVGAAATTFALQGLRLHYTVTIDGVATDGYFTFTAASYADMAAVAAAVGSNIPGIVATVNANQLVLTTSRLGAKQGIIIHADSTALPTLPFAPDATAVGTDILYTGLAGNYLTFRMNQNPHTYQVLAPTDSLQSLVEEINKVVGATVASIISNTFLRLTSTLAGAASEMTIINTGVSGAEDLLGLTDSVAGAARPFPDVYLDDSLVLHLGAEVLRDSVTGYPLDQSFDTGSFYIQYRALRKDVSAVAKVPGVLRISDIDTLTSVLDPITEENPLGLGLFLTMLNAPTFEVKGLGIDEVTAAAPEGTDVAWARAAALLEAEEVYAIAPLTQSESVHSMWMTHCSVMSAPEQGGERIVFPNKVMPTRKNSRIAVSGSSANTTAQTNQVLIDTNPTAGLVDLGLNPALGFQAVDGVFLELTVSGELRRYNVSSVSGSLVNLRTTFAGGENDDAFYSDIFLNTSVVNSSYALKVRGASLVVPGSNPARYDYQLMAETVAEANGLIKNRRVYEVFPDTVKLTVSGVEKALPGYYASAAIVGMVASQPPQQGFTNFPITGLTGVQGTEKFTKRQQNIMAGGGTYILMQEVPGGSVFCRHQVSTDLTSVETRELSITKVVDFVAKILRLGVRRFIGTSNVNTQLLDMLGATVHAILKFLEETGVLNGSNINNLVQDKSNPDTVLIDVTLDVPYPCNYIRLTLMV